MAFSVRSRQSHPKRVKLTNNNFCKHLFCGRALSLPFLLDSLVPRPIRAGFLLFVDATFRLPPESKF